MISMIELLALIKNMKTIHVYEPAMCCSTGICGPDINPDLINFAATLVQLGNRGVQVHRYNLGQQAMAFAKEKIVKECLQNEGVECLPLIFCDGELKIKGRYPTTDERRAWVNTSEQ